MCEERFLHIKYHHVVGNDYNKISAKCFKERYANINNFSGTDSFQIASKSYIIRINF